MESFHINKIKLDSQCGLLNYFKLFILGNIGFYYVGWILKKYQVSTLQNFVFNVELCSLSFIIICLSTRNGATNGLVKITCTTGTIINYVLDMSGAHGYSKSILYLNNVTKIRYLYR